MALFINGVGQDSFNMNGVSIDNLYVDDVLVWTAEVINPDAPPIYLLTEDLVNPNVEVFVENSSSGGEQFNGGLRTLSDGFWSPNEAHYPKDGTIELGDTGGGEHKINTQWAPPVDEEWSMTGIYDVDKGNSYKMYTIHYKGNLTADIYLGSNTGGTQVPMSLSEADKPYTPPTEPWEVFETPPDIINEAPSIIEQVYITFGESAPSGAILPNGKYLNALNDRFETGVITTQKSDNTLSEVTIQQIVNAHSTNIETLNTGDNSGCIYDAQFDQAWVASSSLDRELSIYLPVGTWRLYAGSSRDSAATDRVVNFIFNGQTFVVDGSTNTTPQDSCVTFDDAVSAGEFFSFVYKQDGPSVSNYGYLNGITLERIA